MYSFGKKVFRGNPIFFFLTEGFPILLFFYQLQKKVECFIFFLYSLCIQLLTKEWITYLLSGLQVSYNTSEKCCFSYNGWYIVRKIGVKLWLCMNKIQVPQFLVTVMLSSKSFIDSWNSETNSFLVYMIETMASTIACKKGKNELWRQVQSVLFFKDKTCMKMERIFLAGQSWLW